ncbi:MAG: hypothetical protein U0903_17335 [Planctomycetales bacterium]
MSSSALIHELEAQLQQQELLISALTDSLEQTANELDRTKRGLMENPPPRVADNTSYEYESPPVEFMEEQQTLVHEMRDCVHQWQEMQSGLTLERIEGQLQEIRDLVENLSHLPVPAPVAPEPQDWKASLAMQMERQGADPLAAILGAQKQVLARPVEPVEETPAAPPEPEPEITTTAPEASASGTHKETPPLERMPALPEEIDLENATIEELRAAVTSRDECLQKLTDYVHAINTVEIPVFDLKDYDSLPEDQRQKLEAWEAVLRENNRRVEVELSVERAQLSRELQKFEQQQVQMAKERKRMALLQKTLKPQVKRAKVQEEEVEPKGSWLNVFRWGGKAEEGEGDESEDETDD